MFALHSTLMVLVQVIQHFKGSFPEQILACPLFTGHAVVWVKEREENENYFFSFLFSFLGSLGQSGGYVLWISFGPSENSMSKEMMWCLVIDRAFFLSYSSFSLCCPRLCRHILIGCNMLEKEDEVKSKNPFRLWFVFASSIFQVSEWSLQSGISGEYCLWQAESVNRWCYWNFDFHWICVHWYFSKCTGPWDASCTEIRPQRLYFWQGAWGAGWFVVTYLFKSLRTWGKNRSCTWADVTAF